MKRSEMVRLLTAYCNLNTFKTVDEFSGDYLMTLEEGESLLSFLEERGMLPPYRAVGVFEANFTWEPETLKPTPLTDEELADVIANDEDLRDEKK